MQQNTVTSFVQKYTALDESLVTNIALRFASTIFATDSHPELYISYKLAAVL